MEYVPIYPLFIGKGKKKVVTFLPLQKLEKQVEFLWSGTGGMSVGTHISADVW